MIPALAEFLGDYTVQNVIVGAALLGVSSGTLGVFAVLRRQSLLGDTLSHATLPGVALGFIVAGTRHLGSIMTGALLAGSAAALLVLLLVRRTRLKSDAALGSVLAIFFAVGVVLLTLIQQSGNAAQGGLDSFLFGQAAAILRSDLWMMGALTALALALVAAFWKEFKLTTFDAPFAASIGIPVAFAEVLITLTIALAIVIGLQLVGVVLMAAMVVAPAAAARQWITRLESMVVLAALFGALSGVAGAILSASGPNLAAGPLIVICAVSVVLVSLLFAPRRGLLSSELQRRRRSRGNRERQLLAALGRLAREHDDPRYAAEQGMLVALEGRGTRAGMHHLERKGLVRQVPHMPEEGVHWELTDEGHARATGDGAVSSGDDGSGREETGEP